jgi:two-component system response regulator YesN
MINNVQEGIEMWKLLIADDEPKIRRGLAGSLPWEQFGIELAGEAEDGEQALEKARELKPDLLFVDICMPHLDGLEFVERLHEELPESVVIVITGHDEFKYAQQALRLNVFEYLLKPVVKPELENVVARAVEKLSQNKKDKEKNGWLGQQLYENSRTLRDHFLRRWIEGIVVSTEAAEGFEHHGMNFRETTTLMLIKPLQHIDTGKNVRSWDRDLLEFAMGNIIEDLLKDRFDFAVFADKKGNLVLLMDGICDDTKEDLETQLKSKMEALLGKFIMVAKQVLGKGREEGPDDYRLLLKDMILRGGLSPIVLLTKSYIEKHYASPELSLQEVADGVQVSPTYLSKQLKKELGSSFVDYLTEVRIRKAIQLMNDPSAKVYEIAERVGYGSQHYFSNAFKKVTGAPPLSYRKGKRGE